MMARRGYCTDIERRMISRFRTQTSSGLTISMGWPSRRRGVLPFSRSSSRSSADTSHRPPAAPLSCCQFRVTGSIVVKIAKTGGRDSQLSTLSSRSGHFSRRCVVDAAAWPYADKDRGVLLLLRRRCRPDATTEIAVHQTRRPGSRPVVSVVGLMVRNCSLDCQESKIDASKATICQINTHSASFVSSNTK